MSKTYFAGLLVVAALVSIGTANPTLGAEPKSPYELLVAISKTGVNLPRSTAEEINTWTRIEVLYNRTLAARKQVTKVEEAHKAGTVRPTLLDEVRADETANLKALQAEVNKLAR